MLKNKGHSPEISSEKKYPNSFLKLRMQLLSLVMETPTFLTKVTGWDKKRLTLALSAPYVNRKHFLTIYTPIQALIV